MIYSEAHLKSLPWLPERTILLHAAGSHAYGLNTPTSDIDLKGVCIAPAQYYTGFLRTFQQAEDLNPECQVTVFNLPRFFQLAAECNPNIIETLFVDEEIIYQITNFGRRLLNLRDLFISKKAKFTFSGYAIYQLKRIRTHRKWLLDPPTRKPERADFALPEAALLSKDIMGAIQALETKREDDVGDSSVDLVESFPAQVMEVYAKERQYHNAMTQWAQYCGWKKNRNQKRAEIELKYGYDCYQSTTTEFLTTRGWKFFDEVGDNSLATVNKSTGELCFEAPISKVDKRYTGLMYILNPQSSRAVVTAGHNLLVSRCHRAKQNNFSTKYYEDLAEWQLVPAEEVINGPRSWYHVRHAPAKREFPHLVVEEDLLTVGGLYLSDGCTNYREGGSIRSVRLTQSKEGKFHEEADRVMLPLGAIKYVYEKETVWALSGRWAEEINRLFGARKEKRLPSWSLSLSSHQANVLWEALMLGDGTRYDNRDVYYTSSKELADDIQASMLSSGFPCLVYGPYESDTPYGSCEMYHVVRTKRDRIRTFNTELNADSLFVENERVVCFEVPSGTLVTRNRGLPAIHGNCKHAMHLVRLMRMCEEILSGKGVIVRRPDREDLLGIRNGALSYEQLMEYVEGQEARLDAMYEASTLPREVNRTLLDHHCREMVEEMNWPNFLPS